MMRREEATHMETSVRQTEWNQSASFVLAAAVLFLRRRN
jgi:hypothetical protein